MRRRYVYDKQGNSVEINNGRAIAVHEVMPDIGRYRSVVDGSVIEGRAQHREHLRRHGMRELDPSEVSAERIAQYKGIPDVAPQQRKELIRAQVDSMTHDEFKRALKRDLDNARWNSRID